MFLFNAMCKFFLEHDFSQFLIDAYATLSELERDL